VIIRYWNNKLVVGKRKDILIVNMAKKKQQIKKAPIWIGVGIILLVFIGIFTSIVGINNIVNYFHPYFFGFIFGGIGLVLGIMVAIKIKPYVAVNQKQKRDYWLPIMYISACFFGISVLTGSMINQEFSKVENCDNYTVINKYRQEYRRGSPEINSLVVEINGESHRLVCNFNYWDRIDIGQTINLCLYKSKLGFDYVKITNDK